MVNKAIENAQVRTEGYHFDVRKHLVEYDDIVNKHRDVIYSERNKILSGIDLKTNILSMVEQEIDKLVDEHLNPNLAEPDVEGFLQDINTIVPPYPELKAVRLLGMKPDDIKEELINYTQALI